MQKQKDGHLSENDLCKRARMSQMAFSMYQFTRGEGDLKTTQDLFTQAEFLLKKPINCISLSVNFHIWYLVANTKMNFWRILIKVPTFCSTTSIYC
ncbi:hypothetical protein CEXT_555541 [Caerostris extrusa]|uniref:Uncharacterized protein n=1 Tax=Caerostris extrusa TaxID=172846 RepID=A0AAV4QFP0_CAEEX|nr:hypothetical protein CEXT_555541 [Caerostris extrusa]